MNDLKNIFNNNETAYSEIIALTLRVFSEFRDGFFEIIKTRLGLVNFDFHYNETDLSIETEYFITGNGKRPDIKIEGHNFFILIENKIDAKLTNEGNQFRIYDQFLDGIEEKKCFLVFLCPNKYLLPDNQYPENKKRFCRISYKDLLGVLNNIKFENEKITYLKYLYEYLKEIEMAPFTGFNKENIKYFLNNSRYYKKQEKEFFENLESALNSIFFEDNGVPYFGDLEFTRTKDRRWLDRERTIGDYGKIVKIKEFKDYTIWIMFRFNEGELSLEMYLFCPNDETAQNLNRILDDKLGIWRNEIYLPPLSLLQNIGEEDWESIRKRIRDHIKTNIELFKPALEKLRN